MRAPLGETLALLQPLDWHMYLWVEIACQVSIFEIVTVFFQSMTSYNLLVNVRVREVEILVRFTLRTAVVDCCLASLARLRQCCDVSMDMDSNSTDGNEEFNEPAAPRGPRGTPYGRDVARRIVSYLDWPNESSDGAINWTPREWLIGCDKRCVSRQGMYERVKAGSLWPSWPESCCYTLYALLTTRNGLVVNCYRSLYRT